LPGADSPIRICTACAADATPPSGAAVVLLSAMNAAMARAEMNRRRPIGTLASAPLRNRSYKVLRAMPPNNARACSIDSHGDVDGYFADRTSPISHD
jgi:hypothetical protein